MEMNFCRRCGTKLEHLENHIFRCESGHIIFANCSPTVGIFLITKNKKVVLSIRGIEPHKGMLDTFGGFVDGEETIEAAVARELKEELGLNPSDYSEPRFICTGVGHYPYKGEELPIISSFFWADLLSEETLIPADDVAGVFIDDPKNIDPKKLHDDDIRIGLDKLIQMHQSL